MPSRRMLRELYESLVHERLTQPGRDLSPFDEDIHVPQFFRRRPSAEIRAIQASVFENPEPFLPFRPSTRKGLDPPPLSPKSRKEPAWVWPGLGCAACDGIWTRDGSAKFPIVIDDDETDDGAFEEDEGRRGSRVSSQGQVIDEQSPGSPRSEYASRTDTETSKGSGSVVDENDLRCGACHETSSYRSSSLGDDEVTTPERGQDAVEPYIRGGGEDEFERPDGFRNLAEDWNSWERPPCAFEELWEYVGDEELQPGAEQDRRRSEVKKETRGFEDGVEIEDKKTKTWRKFGDVYFLKEDDDSFEPSDDVSEVSEKRGQGIETWETMGISRAHLAAISTTTPAPARVKTPEPGRKDRRVAFAVDTTVEEEEACRYAQMRCVRCPRRPAERCLRLG